MDKTSSYFKFTQFNNYVVINLDFYQKFHTISVEVSNKINEFGKI